MSFFLLSFKAKVVPLLEDRMRGWIKKDLPFKQLDMMAANAEQFLKTMAICMRLKLSGVNSALSRLSSWIILRAFARTLETSSEVQFYKIVTAQLHGSWMRLIGTAAFSKDELKAQVKALKEMPSHLSLVKEGSF